MVSLSRFAAAFGLTNQERKRPTHCSSFDKLRMSGREESRASC